MTRQDFENILIIGEHVGVEFKRGGNGAQNDTFETVCAFLNRFGGDLFLGELGSGTRNLYRYTRLCSGAYPVIDEEDVFSISIPLNDDFSQEAGDNGAAQSDQGSIQKSGLNAKGELTEKLTEKLTETEKEIVVSVMVDCRITQGALSQKIGIARPYVSKLMAGLQSKGVIRRVGPDKGGHWEVVGNQ